MDNSQKRILMAKTGLDGHWRGPTIVARVGLNIGGHINVALRAVNSVREARPEVPVFAGGTVPPHAKKQLEALGVEVFPPGSQLYEIVAAAERLTHAADSA
jgi:methylmalonyl-CoA mutase C-terminal domain/subunit